MAFGQVDPTQAVAPRRPWLFCVGESGSRSADDPVVERRSWEAGQTPWSFPSGRNHSPDHLSIGEWLGQCGQDLNILDNTGLFAMVL